MKRFAAVAIIGFALVACGGSAPPKTEPEPTVAPAAPAPPPPMAPLRYRFRANLVYDIERHDTLFYASMPGAPQSAGKVGVLTVRPRTGTEVEVVLDSLTATADSRLAATTIDSTLGARWQVVPGPAGGRAAVSGGRRTVLGGQLEEFVRLLFPQLPLSGLRPQDTWADSSNYRVQVDAFDALESAQRSSHAADQPTSIGGGLAVHVEATDRLNRTGTAMQGGQTMALHGDGTRELTYDFAAEGWVRNLMARDSLNLVVTIPPASETILVRWHSTLTARLRGVPPR